MTELKRFDVPPGEQCDNYILLISLGTIMETVVLNFLNFTVALTKRYDDSLYSKVVSCHAVVV